jgi:hypothetical protein
MLNRIKQTQPNALQPPAKHIDIHEAVDSNISSRNAQ